MRKVKIYFLSILIACGMGLSAQAIPPMPPGPLDPTVDAPNDVVFFLNTAQAAISNATAQANVFIQNLSLQAKSMLTKYVGKFQSFVGGIFKKGDKQELPGAVEIVEAKVADIYDPVSIQAAMYELFFQYPADCNDTSNIKNVEKCRQYEEAAKLLHQKTIIEAYTVVREIEKQLPELEQSIDDVEAALQEGKDGSEDPENGDNAIAKNLYAAYSTMDSILKIIEEVEALKAQYTAAQAIGTLRVRPALPEKKDKKNKKAENDVLPIWKTNSVKFAVTKVKETEKLRFASITDDDDEEDEEEKEELSYNRMSFVAAPDNGMKSPFAGNEKELELLPKISQAYGYLRSAMDIHNTLQSLDGMRNAYDAYDKMRRIHDKSVESLKATEQCVINYYDQFYEDPHQMWSGGLSLDYAVHHDLRKGLSAWAYKAYALAKAEDTGMVLDADDFAESDVDTSDIDVNNMQEAQDKIKGRITQDPNGGFKDANKQAELNGSMKESELIVWNIGTEAAKMLAQDQKNSQQIEENKWKGKWGTAKMRYPVWKDVQNFYNQYIIEKYDSINRRLRFVNTNELFLNVAKQISQVSDNKKAIENMRSLVTKKQSETTNNIEKLAAEKKAKIEALERKRDLDLAQNEKADEAVVRKINAKQAELDNLSTQLQEASRDRQKADKTASAMETVIESLQKWQEEQPVSKYIETTKEEYQVDINRVKSQKQSSLIYKGIYESKETVINAQVLYSDDRKSLLTGKALGSNEVERLEPDIRTYEMEIKEEKEVEYDEPESLAVARYTYDENTEKVEKLDDEISSLNEKIEKLQEEKAKEEQNREALAAKKEEIKKKYAEDVHDIIVQYDTEIEKAEKEYYANLEKENNIDFIAFFNDKNNRYEIVKNLHLQNFEELLSVTNAILDATKNAAEEIVNATRDNILSIEDLYNRDNPAVAEKIYEHHKNMIEALKKLPEQNLEAQDAIHPYKAFGIISLLRNMYSSYLTSDACVSDTCLTEKETTYFAGNMGNRRDFLVPITSPQSTLPSVREAVYFDYEDFDRIPKTAEGYVSPKDIISNLSYLPDIWVKILTSPAFVEKDINLKEFLSADKLKGSQEKLALGGVFPCWYPSAKERTYLVAWKGAEFGVYGNINAGTTASGLEAAALAKSIAQEKEAYEKTKKLNYVSCQNLYIEKVRSGFLGSSSRVKVRNVAESTEKEPIESETKVKSFSDYKIHDSESELGYLFEHDGKGLKYNELAKTMFSTLSKANKDANTKMSQKNVMYDLSSLIHSQIGEFLRAVDTEQEALKSMEKIAEEIENNKENLKEIFAKIEPDENKRFIPADNIDLSKDEDYSLIKSKLMEYRKNKLDAAKSVLSSAQSSTNEAVKDRIEKVNNMIKLITKDSKAYVVLSDSMDAGASLDEKIKTETVNRELISRQKKEADKAFEEELKRMGKIYCSQLLDNM